MATAIKICRVCGKSYEACHSMKRNAETFHWQEVACSPECGSEYFRRIEESRNAQTPQEPVIENVTEDAEDISIADVYQEEDFDEDFDEDVVESLFEDIEPDEFGNE